MYRVVVVGWLETKLAGEVDTDLAASAAEIEGCAVDRQQDRGIDSPVRAGELVPVAVGLAAVDTPLGYVDRDRTKFSDRLVQAFEALAVGGCPTRRDRGEIGRERCRFPYGIRRYRHLAIEDATLPRPPPAAQRHVKPTHGAVRRGVILGPPPPRQGSLLHRHGRRFE